jgi:predicted amidohydrolase
MCAALAKNFIASAIQMTSIPDRAANLRKAEGFIREAAQQGATLIGLPEHFNWLGPQRDHSKNFESEQGPTFQMLSDLAKELEIWLHSGSFFVSEKPGKTQRAKNTSYLFNPSGQIQAKYEKIHLFDVEVAQDRSYRESKTTAPGERISVASTALGCIGMAICYDLRFPELFRFQSENGVGLFMVPSAFTVVTGKAHWKILLQARAVENFSYLIAPAQWGSHYGRRRTFGHSAIVDPWGRILSEKKEGEGPICSDIDARLLEQVRSDYPSLEHRKPMDFYA